MPGSRREAREAPTYSRGSSGPTSTSWRFCGANLKQGFERQEPVRALLLLLKLLVDELGEAGGALGPDQLDSVDEERGGAAHPVLLAVLEVLLDFLLLLTRVEAGLELVLVEAQSRRGLHEIRRGELGLVGEHGVVHLPVLALVL